MVSCQTTEPNKDQTAEPVSKAESIRQTQLALVRNALDTGNPQAALRSLRELLHVRPEDTDFLNLMGLTELALRNPPRAERYFAKAYRLNKAPATALNLSSAYIEAGETAKATNLLSTLIKAKGKDAYQYRERVYHNLGYAYVKAQRLGKAEHWFKEAIDENPGYFPSQVELARIYERTRRPALARRTYREAIDNCRACFEPVYSLSMLYMQSGSPVEARKLLMQFLRVEGITATDKQRATALLKTATVSQMAHQRAG